MASSTSAQQTSLIYSSAAVTTTTTTPTSTQSKNNTKTSIITTSSAQVKSSYPIEMNRSSSACSSPFSVNSGCSSNRNPAITPPITTDEEFKKMESVVNNLLTYKKQIDLLKLERTSLAQIYESKINEQNEQIKYLQEENLKLKCLLNNAAINNYETTTSTTTKATTTTTNINNSTIKPNNNNDTNCSTLDKNYLARTSTTNNHNNNNCTCELEHANWRRKYEFCLNNIMRQLINSLKIQETIRIEYFKLENSHQKKQLLLKQDQSNINNNNNNNEINTKSNTIITSTNTSISAPSNSFSNKIFDKNNFSTNKYCLSDKNIDSLRISNDEDEDEFDDDDDYFIYQNENDHFNNGLDKCNYSNNKKRNNKKKKNNSNNCSSSNNNNNSNNKNSFCTSNSWTFNNLNKNQCQLDYKQTSTNTTTTSDDDSMKKFQELLIEQQKQQINLLNELSQISNSLKQEKELFITNKPPSQSTNTSTTTTTTNATSTTATSNITTINKQPTDSITETNQIKSTNLNHSQLNCNHQEQQGKVQANKNSSAKPSNNKQEQISVSNQFINVSTNNLNKPSKIPKYNNNNSSINNCTSASTNKTSSSVPSNKKNSGAVVNNKEPPKNSINNSSALSTAKKQQQKDLKESKCLSTSSKIPQRLQQSSQQSINYSNKNINFKQNSNKTLINDNENNNNNNGSNLNYNTFTKKSNNNNNNSNSSANNNSTYNNKKNTSDNKNQISQVQTNPKKNSSTVTATSAQVNNTPTTKGLINSNTFDKSTSNQLTSQVAPLAKTETITEVSLVDANLSTTTPVQIDNKEVLINNTCNNSNIYYINECKEKKLLINKNIVDILLVPVPVKLNTSTNNCTSQPKNTQSTTKQNSTTSSSSSNSPSGKSKDDEGYSTMSSDLMHQIKLNSPPGSTNTTTNESSIIKDSGIRINRTSGDDYSSNITSYDSSSSADPHNKASTSSSSSSKSSSSISSYVNMQQQQQLLQTSTKYRKNIKKRYCFPTLKSFSYYYNNRYYHKQHQQTVGDENSQENDMIITNKLCCKYLSDTDIASLANQLSSYDKDIQYNVYHLDTLYNNVDYILFNSYASDTELVYNFNRRNGPNQHFLNSNYKLYINDYFNQPYDDDDDEEDEDEDERNEFRNSEEGKLEEEIGIGGVGVSVIHQHVLEPLDEIDDEDNQSQYRQQHKDLLLEDYQLREEVDEECEEEQEQGMILDEDDNFLAENDEYEDEEEQQDYEFNTNYKKMSITYDYIDYNCRTNDFIDDMDLNEDIDEDDNHLIELTIDDDKIGNNNHDDGLLLFDDDDVNLLMILKQQQQEKQRLQLEQISIQNNKSSHQASNSQSDKYNLNDYDVFDTYEDAEENTNLEDDNDDKNLFSSQINSPMFSSASLTSGSTSITNNINNNSNRRRVNDNRNKKSPPSTSSSSSISYSCSSCSCSSGSSCSSSSSSSSSLSPYSSTNKSTASSTRLSIDSINKTSPKKRKKTYEKLNISNHRDRRNNNNKSNHTNTNTTNVSSNENKKNYSDNIDNANNNTNEHRHRHKHHHRRHHHRQHDYFTDSIDKLYGNYYNNKYTNNNTNKSNEQSKHLVDSNFIDKFDIDEFVQELNFQCNLDKTLITSKKSSKHLKELNMMAVKMITDSAKYDSVAKPEVSNTVTTTPIIHKPCGLIRRHTITSMPISAATLLPSKSTLTQKASNSRSPSHHADSKAYVGSYTIMENSSGSCRRTSIQHNNSFYSRNNSAVQSPVSRTKNMPNSNTENSLIVMSCGSYNTTPNHNIMNTPTHQASTANSTPYKINNNFNNDFYRLCSDTFYYGSDCNLNNNVMNTPNHANNSNLVNAVDVSSSSSLYSSVQNQEVTQLDHNKPDEHKNSIHFEPNLTNHVNSLFDQWLINSKQNTINNVSSLQNTSNE